MSLAAEMWAWVLGFATFASALGALSRFPWARWVAGLVLLPIWLAFAALGLVLINSMGLQRVGYEAITQPLVVVTAYGLGLIVAHVVAMGRSGPGGPP